MKNSAIKQDAILSVLIKGQTSTIHTIHKMECKDSINQVVLNHARFCGSLCSMNPDEKEYTEKKSLKSGEIICKVREERFKELCI